MSMGGFQGTEGHALASLEWLLLHHRVKLSARRRISRSLLLSPGMSVLDLGCGPGLWTQLLAEQVAPHGRVHGLDLDPVLIEHAKNHTEARGDVHPTYEVSDFRDLSKHTGDFDAAFTANCFPYEDDAEALLRGFSRCLRPNGILIGRHFDNTFWMASAVDPAMASFVLHTAAAAGRVGPNGAYFDNSFGQRMHASFRGAGLRDVRTRSVTIDLSAPLSEADKDYLSTTAEWTSLVAKRSSDDPRIDEWLSHFDPTSRNYVLDQADCIFTFLEYTTIGSVGN